MTAKAVFVDTTILVYATQSTSPLHVRARQRIDEIAQAGATLWISRQIVREFVAAATRVAPGLSPLPLADALSLAQVFLERFQVAEDSAQVLEECLRIVRATGTSGRQVHDANIVATMKVAGISTLLTHNASDFQRFSAEITVERL
jgi:predicted nucleic acid-binding protein